MNSHPYNQHFIFDKKVKGAQNFTTFRAGATRSREALIYRTYIFEVF